MASAQPALHTSYRGGLGQRMDDGLHCSGELLMTRWHLHFCKAAQVFRILLDKEGPVPSSSPCESFLGRQPHCRPTSSGDPQVTCRYMKVGAVLFWFRPWGHLEGGPQPPPNHTKYFLIISSLFPSSPYGWVQETLTDPGKTRQPASPDTSLWNYYPTQRHSENTDFKRQMQKSP